MAGEGTKLRPLSTPEALDAAILLLARSPARAYAIATVGTLPVAALALGYFYWTGTILEGQDDRYWTGTVLWAAAMALAWIWLSIGRGALAVAALADARGDVGALPARECWRRALKQAPSLALVGAGAAVVMALATPCAGALALFPLAAWMVARPAVADEDRRETATHLRWVPRRWVPLAAFARSSTLTLGHRGRAARLWGAFVLLGLAVLLNLYGLGQSALSALNGVFGHDVGAWEAVLSYRNPGYVAWLLALGFLLLDPLKSCADVALYLDLRIRREGADLQERLRALARGAGGAALLCLLIAGGARPAGAASLEEYRQSVSRLRQQVAAAKVPADVDPALSRAVARETVRTPVGESVAVDNRWLTEALGNWREDGGPTLRAGTTQQAILRRLDALERALGDGVRTDSTQPYARHPTPYTLSPEESLKAALARPEFQALADRPELGRLAGELRPQQAKGWFQRFWEWVRKQLLKFREPKARAPDAGNYSWDSRSGEYVLWGLLALVVALLLALIVRALFVYWGERPGPKPLPTTWAPAAAPASLEESQTENALDHSPDQWEQFAAEWLRRGDLRQAVRALYLALLVDLHRQRLIDYDRARTNWHYVRHFGGAAEAGEVLRRLTERFDLAWYGRRHCTTEQFQEFQAGVRTLAAADPVGGLAHA